MIESGKGDESERVKGRKEDRRNLGDTSSVSVMLTQLKDPPGCVRHGEIIFAKLTLHFGDLNLTESLNGSKELCKLDAIMAIDE